MARVRTNFKSDSASIIELLRDETDYLLNHRCKTIAKEQLHLPGPSFIDDILIPSEETSDGDDDDGDNAAVGEPGSGRLLGC